MHAYTELEHTNFHLGISRRLIIEYSVITWYSNEVLDNQEKASTVLMTDCKFKYYNIRCVLPVHTAELS